MRQNLEQRLIELNDRRNELLKARIEMNADYVAQFRKAYPNSAALNKLRFNHPSEYIMSEIIRTSGEYKYIKKLLRECNSDAELCVRWLSDKK